MRCAIITPATGPLRGTLSLPGDKSVSHRAALLSLFVKNEVALTNYATGRDCSATLTCLERLGKTIERSGSAVRISGELHGESAELDCGNSGTTARLLMGILSARKGHWVLRGDTSLSKRPMERVAEPLRLMGARIELTNGCLPARIEGAGLRGIEYDSPLASAQVKTAVLFAGLQAEGITRYREPFLTRDHTERMLNLKTDSDGWIAMDPRGVRLGGESLSGTIPSDPSTAAFWIVAALMIPESELSFGSVLSNPLRTAYIDLLLGAGARIEHFSAMSEGTEAVANLEAKHSRLKALTARGSESAKVMDEIPVLAVLATRAEGTSVFGDIGELRVKESNRLTLIAENLKRMGAKAREQDDSLLVGGDAELSGARIVTGGDHRIAMVFAIAGLVAQGRTVIDDADCVGVSYPGFWDDFRALAPDSLTLE
jgi:3-phosphoshikimate 1-carboxyvinyltransferase